MHTDLESLNIQGYFYPVLNILALTLIYYFCYQQGIKDGLDRKAWSITLFIRFIFFIIGCKLFTISFHNVLSNSYETQALLSQRTLAGGIVYGLIAFTVMFFYFKLPSKVFDYAIIPMLVGLSLQKAGCFIAGCCFGEIYNGPISVTYSNDSPVFYSHLSNHFINTNDTLSLSVHPVQLYEVAGYLLAIFFILQYRHKVKVSGSLLILTSILILSNRFITNFFRDSASYIFLGKSPENLFRMQISIGVLILILSVFYFLIEHKKLFATARNLNCSPWPSWPWLFIGFICLFATRSWYNGFELIFLSGILLVAIFQHIKTYPIIVWGRVAVMVCTFLLLTSQQNAPAKKDSVVEQYHKVRLGTSAGQFVNSLTFDDGDGCDAKTRYFIQKQTMFGASYSTNKTRLRQNYKGKAYTLQTEMLYYTFLGSQSEQWADNPGHITDYNVFGGGVQFRDQMKWIGVGVGVNVGNLRLAYQNKVKNQSSTTDPDEGYWRTPVLPSGYFRVGPRHILFGEYSYAQNFPSPSPSQYSMFMVGTGLGLKNGTELKFGTLTGIQGKIISLKFPVGKQLGIESYYHFGNAQSYLTSNEKQKQFSFSIEYKLSR